MSIIEVDFTGNKKPYFNPSSLPGRAGYCSHRTVEVDKYTRQVNCTECGQILDAFDYLHGLARKEIKLFEQLDMLRKEEAELTKRVEALRHEERNIKARLKNAYKKEMKTPPKPPVLAAKYKQSCLDEIKQALGENGNSS